jgi:hypothetical protein
MLITNGRRAARDELLGGSGDRIWTGYSNKAGVGSAVNEDKLEQVVEHMYLLHEYIPICRLFILGLDRMRRPAF